MLRLVNFLLLFVVAGSVSAEISGRVRVVDGDTFRLGSLSIRLHGIDAPEQDQTCKDKDGATWSCGAWVTERARALFQNRMAHCVEITTDRYGRTVARCSVAGQDMGQRLVSDGLAFAYRRYSMAYDLDEKAALVAGRGLHGSRVQKPADFRRSGASNRDAAGPAGCLIKGNISASGRIFHVPGQEHYDRTRIARSKGERWFCSEPEAIAAGWRKARR